MTVESEVPEINIKQPQTTDGIKPQLRTVDLNLLTVFDAVMQEQNITRAAHTLGMSQPAVSNAVARLKVMFNDELFVRYRERNTAYRTGIPVIRLYPSGVAAGSERAARVRL